MSKIKNITVSNLKAVSSLSVDFNGCTAIVTGGNNKGKSTFLRGLIDRIKGIKPAQIVKLGEDASKAQLELTTGEKFIWQAKSDGREKLTFITKDNIKTSVTKEIANRYFPNKFDIDKFLNEPPRKQQESLERLLGIDFTELDAQYKEAYEQRTIANRIAKQEREKCAPFDRSNAHGQLVDVVEMEKNYRKLEQEDIEIDYITNNIIEARERIEDIEDQIDALLEKKKLYANKVVTEKDKLLPLKGFFDEEQKENMLNSIEKAKQKNHAIEKNKMLIEQHEFADNAELEAKKYDDAVQAIISKKKEIIEQAQVPSGFSFGDDGLLVDGLTLSKEQLSSSRVYISALKLAALGVGEVRCFHFDASHLDKNSLADIEAWANENDLQLLIERPDWDGGEIEYTLINE